MTERSKKFPVYTAPHMPFIRPMAFLIFIIIFVVCYMGYGCIRLFTST